MKKLLLFCLFNLLTFSASYAQELPEVNKIKLNKASQYKDAEALVLKTTQYLLTQDLELKKVDRRKAGQFLIKWMNGTPHHTFYLEKQDIRYFENNTDYILSFMAALTQYSLAHPDLPRQSKFIGALELVLPYLQKFTTPKDRSRELEELMYQFDNNQLADYIAKNYID
ncbi:MAG: hypothetical protein EOO99_07190 [Pedobacter sp.]|nr:MAG: hypothetical protein EOO99_07190 [Pedobacter sp.]